MTEIVVIDANVWGVVNRLRDIGNIESAIEIDCIQRCRDWLREFVNSENKLALDLSHTILTEYRDNVTDQGGLARQLLNNLQSNHLNRLEYVSIKFDENGDAILPDNITFHDRSDRKFIAVAIQFDPYAPIYNATDTDWAKEKTKLESMGLMIQELCLDYIILRLKADAL